MDKLLQTFEEMNSIVHTIIDDDETQLKAALLFLDYAQACVKNIKPAVRLQENVILINDSFAL